MRKKQNRALVRFKGFGKRTCVMGLTAFDGYQMANRKGRMELGGGHSEEVGVGDVLCEPLRGNVTCERCLYPHACRCQYREMCVYMYKIIFLPIGSFRYQAVACHLCLCEMINCVVNVSSSSMWICSPSSFPEEDETLQFQPREPGGLAGDAGLAWVTALPCLHLSCIQC